MKSMKRLFVGILVIALVIAMIPAITGEKKVHAAESTVITAPANNVLLPAGYINIAWNKVDGSVKNYELYIDGKKVTTTNNTEYEYYTTQVKQFTTYVNTVYTDGSSVKSEERSFFVTKKGLAVNDTMGRRLSPLEMNMGWYYTWGNTPFSYTTYKNAEFVPMVWGTENEDRNLSRIASENYRYLLAYNEPDYPLYDQWGNYIGGSNVPVETAIANWPKFQGKSKYLGTPAPAQCPAWDGGSWMRTFLSRVSVDDYDFIPLHCYYGTYGGAAGANSFLKDVVDATYNMYHKPIWVTEFAVTGWGYNNAQARASMKEFVQTVIKGLNERSYVERYSWFSFDTTDNGNGASALWTNSTGALTELGKVYVNEGNPEGYDYHNAGKATTNNPQSTTTQKPQNSTTQKPQNSTTQGVQKTTAQPVKKPGRVVIKKATKKKKAKSAKIVLKKVKGAKGYQIRFCDSKNFQGYETKTIKKNKVKITLKGLERKTQYYIKVRAYNKKANGKKQYGKWSKTKKIKMKK